MAFSSPVSAEVWPDFRLKDCSPRRGLWKSRILLGHSGIKKSHPANYLQAFRKKLDRLRLRKKGGVVGAGVDGCLAACTAANPEMISIDCDAPI